MSQKLKYVIKPLSITVIIFMIHGHILYAQKHSQFTENNRSIILMTYNLKFASSNYQPLWEERRDMQIEMIKKYQPDIIGTQEGLKEQIDYLADHLTDYVVIGEGRQGGDDDEHMAIFYKREKFRLRELNSFALSKTPKIIGSGPQVNPRMMTWARFAFINRLENIEKRIYPSDYRGHWENTQEFYVFNTHFFNGSEPEGRLSASKLIKQHIDNLQPFGSWEHNRPIFLIGDFNCHPKSAPHKLLVGNESGGHSNVFKDSNTINNKEIDWVLYKGSLTVLKYEEVDFNINGVYPSDHKPILVKFIVNK